MNDTNKSINKCQVSLCRKTTCCPQLIIEDGKYIITDDNGGRVVLEKEHIEELIVQYINTETEENEDKFAEQHLNLFSQVRKDVDWSSLPLS